jgi:hypothetical protein
MSCFTQVSFSVLKLESTFPQFQFCARHLKMTSLHTEGIKLAREGGVGLSDPSACLCQNAGPTVAR